MYQVTFKLNLNTNFGMGKWEGGNRSVCYNDHFWVFQVKHESRVKIFLTLFNTR